MQCGGAQKKFQLTANDTESGLTGLSRVPFRIKLSPYSELRPTSCAKPAFLLMTNPGTA